MSFRTMLRRSTWGVLVLALALGACDDDPAPPFEVEGQGSLEGMLFLDVDRDGRFDPAAGDRVLPNVNVRLVERGTTRVIQGAQTTTNASGRFSLANLPAGTHELAIDTVGVGADVAFCQNPIPVTIFVNEPQFRDVAARGGCVITIAEAESRAVGANVTVRGIVVSSPGQIVSNRMYIQDETGGIRMFNVAGASAVQVGDVVEVTGTLALNAGEFELVSARLNEHVEAGGTATPAPTTTKEIADAGAVSAAEIQGMLVSVSAAKVTREWNNQTGSSRNAFIDDGSGQTVVRIDTGVIFVSGSVADLVAQLNQIMTLGKCYDVVGIAASFNATGQLFPRTLADITEVPCP